MFVTPFGTYRFVRMPFGLKNAPATFQSLIDRFRSGSTVKDITLLAYLDDLLVLSDGYEQHHQDLDRVFDRLRDFGLRANRDKCVFASKEVKYLGHLITSEGIKPDGSKVQAILKIRKTFTHISPNLFLFQGVRARLLGNRLAAHQTHQEGRDLDLE